LRSQDESGDVLSGFTELGQSGQSVAKNATWFKDNRDYRAHIEELDTYQRLRGEVDARLTAATSLLDIGSGGVFDFNTDRFPAVTALDLFLDDQQLSKLPANVTYVQGSALDLPFADQSFETVTISMLLHHLTGSNVAQSWANVQKCIAEVARVLRPGGQFLLVESCVPSWFYQFETVVFQAAGATIGKRMSHPITLQYTASSIAALLRQEFSRVTDEEIPKGRWVLQFGWKVPSIMTPVQAHVFTAGN